MIDDWDINVSVRQELVKRFVDLRRIHFSTVSGIVYLKGSLIFTKIKGEEEKVVATIEERLNAEKKRLSSLEKGIKKIKGVKGIIFSLEGWTKCGNEWVRKTGG